MRRFVRDHECAVAEILKAPPERLPAFRDYHERRLGYLQAERFAHLLVMLGVGVFAMLAVLAVLAHPGPATVALLALLLVLFVPYVVHYYFLENAVQRWYGLALEMDRRLGRAPGA